MSELLPAEIIETKIYLIRGKKVMLDRDLAVLYEVDIKVLKRAVKRNIERFPDDFAFELTKSEYDKFLRCQFGALKRGQHSKYMPYAFGENGIAMLSGVLQSPKAVQVNIQIMRTFTRLRQLLSSNRNLKLKIEEMEKKYDSQFKVVFQAIKALIETPKKEIGKIGFVREEAVI